MGSLSAKSAITASVWSVLLLLTTRTSQSMSSGTCIAPNDSSVRRSDSALLNVQIATVTSMRIPGQQWGNTLHECRLRTVNGPRRVIASVFQKTLDLDPVGPIA